MDDEIIKRFVQSTNDYHDMIVAAIQIEIEQLDEQHPNLHDCLATLVNNSQ